MYTPPSPEGDDPAELTANAIEERLLRADLETKAIPLCKTWREQNPEYRFQSQGHWYPILNATMFTPENLVPAPYCCSAYCERCAGLRALDGVDPLLPNGWLHS